MTRLVRKISVKDVDMILDYRLTADEGIMLGIGVKYQ